ncbi:hypothetical protein Tco_1227176 [Tanacetum coccineum]
MAPSGLLFLIFDVHYDGTFNFMPLRYEHGLVYQWSVRKDNHLDLATVWDFLREKKESIILYELFFKLPQCELDVGLKIIDNERDLAMYDYAHEYGKIHDDVKSRRKTVTKDVGNMSVEELVSWAEEEAAMASKASDDDICVTSVLDKGKGLADNGKGLVDKGKGIMVDEGKAGRKTARSRNIGIIIRENVNPTFSEDDDSDNSESEYSDKSIYYLSEGHTLRSYTPRMKQIRISLRDKGDVLTDPIIILENDQSNKKFPIYDEHTHWKMRKPKVGEKYVDTAQLNECLTYHSLANRFSLWFYRSLKEQLIARCRMRPEKLKDNEKGKQRKHFKYHGGHSDVMWIGKHFGHKIRQNPKIKLHEIADLVLKKYKCIVSPAQCRDAKTVALNHGERTTEEHYAMIRSYGKEILDSNDGSIVKLGVIVILDDKTYFDRFYCRFYGLKYGFQLGCRPVIALDGCFLKKPNVGEILAAVGRDGNNHIYPIARAVVNVENKYHWSSFLELLGEDIDMPTRNGLTLISDKHNDRFWHVIPVGGNLFEVRNGSKAFTFDEHKCLPCPHSIAVIFKLNKSPEDYILDCFRKDAYYKAYHQYLSPVGAMTFWPDSSMYSTVLPPKPRRMPDRPRKERIRNPHERQFPNRVSRASGCATIHMDDSSSQVRQGGVATGINVGLEGVEADTNVGDGPGTNVGSGGVESSAANDTVRCDSLGDFVSVRSEGTTIRTTSRGELGVRRVRGRLGVRRGRGGLGVSRGRGRVGVSRGRGGQNVGLGVRMVTSEGIPTARIGRGGQTLVLRGKRGTRFRGGVVQGERYDRLGRWFGLVDETQKETLLVTQQSQEGIQQQPQAAEERSQAQVGGVQNKNTAAGRRKTSTS